MNPFETISLHHPLGFLAILGLLGLGLAAFLIGFGLRGMGLRGLRRHRR